MANTDRTASLHLYFSMRCSTKPHSQNHNTVSSSNMSSPIILLRIRMFSDYARIKRKRVLIRFSSWLEFPFSVVSQKCVRIVPTRVDSQEPERLTSEHSHSWPIHVFSSMNSSTLSLGSNLLLAHDDITDHGLELLLPHTVGEPPLYVAVWLQILGIAHQLEGIYES